MHRKRFITNTVFLFGTGLVAQVVSLFVIPLFIDNLGKELYGLFVISNMLMGYVGMLDFGFTQGLTRQIGRTHSKNDKEGLSDAVSTGFWILLIIGLLTSSVIYFGRSYIIDFLHVAESNHTIASNLLIVTAAFSLFQWPLRLSQVILKGTLHIKEQSIVQASVQIFSSITMLGLVLASIGLVGIRLGVCIVMGLGLIVQGLLVCKYISELHWNPLKFRKNAFREMFSYSMGMFYTRLVSMLQVRVDHLIIGGMIGVAAVTPYVIASKLFEVVRKNTGKIFGALLPTVFNLDTDENRHKLQTLLDDGVKYRALLVTPLAFLGIVIGPAFIRTWMGSEYEQYGIWAQLFMILHLITVFGVGQNIARGLGRLRLCNGVMTIRVIVNVSLSILLIPKFGIGGPILGTLISIGLLGDITFFPLYGKVCNLKWRKAFWQGFMIIGSNVPVTILLLFTANYLNISTWVTLLLYSAFSIALLYGTQWVFFIKAGEKRDIFTAFESIGITRIVFAGKLLKKMLL